MKPSIAPELSRDFIRKIALKYRAANPRVFGSVLHGHDLDGSDSDIPVDALPDASLFDLGELQFALQERRGVRVDVLRDAIVAEARPI